MLLQYGCYWAWITFLSHLVGFVISLKMRNQRIRRSQSENNFPRRYDVISNEVIFPALCAGSCLKNKVLVHFVAFSCATFNFKYDILDTSTTLDAKVLEYSRKGNLWLHMTKWRILKTFDDQAFHYVSSVSLNFIWILRENFTTN